MDGVFCFLLKRVDKSLRVREISEEGELFRIGIFICSFICCCFFCCFIVVGFCCFSDFINKVEIDFVVCLIVFFLFFGGILFLFVFLYFIFMLIVFFSCGNVEEF